MASEVWSLVLDPRRIELSIIPPCYFLVDGDDLLTHILKDYNGIDIETSLLDTNLRQLYGKLNKMGIQPIVFLSKGPKKKGSDGQIEANVLATQLRKTLKSLCVDIEDCDIIRRPGKIL
jgi:hypothetical protein